MDRIEGIKERMEIGKHTENGYQPFYAREDIEHLLSKLRIAETALEQARDYLRLEEAWEAATFIDYAIQKLHEDK